MSMRAPKGSGEKEHQRNSVSPAGTPWARLYKSLSNAMRTQYDEFEEAVLRDHLKRRRDRGAYEIDRRNRFLGNAGRLTLREPDPEGGTASGPTTSDLETASRWAKEHYIPQLWHTIRTGQRQLGSGIKTVRADCEAYLKHFGATLELLPRNVPHARAGPPELQSRFSMIRQNVVPALGALVMGALKSKQVEAAAAALTVEKLDADGTRSRVPASPGTQHNFISALRAVWTFNYSDEPCPFHAARVRPPIKTLEKQRVYNFKQIQAELRAAGDKSAVTAAEFERGLVGAMHYDIAQQQRPCIAAGSMIPNTVHLFVALVAFGVRISEALRIRWCDINFDDGYVIIFVSKRLGRNGKLKPEVRVVPLQIDHVPWLRLLQREQGITDTLGNETYLFRTSRHASPLKRGAQTTLIMRAKKVLAYAGIKLPRKATHWGRSTYATWGKSAVGVKGEELQHFLGHNAFPGATDAYTAMMIEMLRPEHRRFIKIPTPARIRSLLKKFTPATTTHWKKRRKVQSRSRAAKEARALKRAEAAQRR